MGFLFYFKDPALLGIEARYPRTHFARVVESRRVVQVPLG